MAIITLVRFLITGQRRGEQASVFHIKKRGGARRRTYGRPSPSMMSKTLLPRALDTAMLALPFCATLIEACKRTVFGMSSVLGSWGEAMRGAVGNKERWERGAVRVPKILVLTIWAEVRPPFLLAWLTDALAAAIE